MKILLHSDQKRGENFPSLGLGYLVSYANKYRPGLKFEASFDREDILEKIRSFKPDLIGFTAVTFTYRNIFSLAKKVKEVFPAIPVIIGGLHITLLPNSLPEYIDAGVLGEGEDTFLELIKTCQNKGELKRKDIKGIVFRENGELIDTGMRELIQPLDRIPPPDLETFSIDKKGPAHIMSSRGCPYKCRFCCSTKYWRKPRLHSAEYMVEEVERFVKNYRRKRLAVYDDLFTMDKNRIKKIADLMCQKGLNKRIKLDITSHVNFIDEELMRDLKRMGVRFISFGMESGSKKVLDYLKNSTVSHEKIRYAVSLCKKYGIPVTGSFMVGSPHETAEDVQQTIDFIKELGLYNFGLNVTTPFPGTDLWEYGKEKGLIKNDHWDDKFWGMHHVNEENIKDKIILADMDRDVFFRQFKKLHGLQLQMDRKNEIKKWLCHPYNLKLLYIHIKGIIKPFKKNIRRKLKKILTRKGFM